MRMTFSTFNMHLSLFKSKMSGFFFYLHAQITAPAELRWQVYGMLKCKHFEKREGSHVKAVILRFYSTDGFRTQTPFLIVLQPFPQSKSQQDGEKED